MPDLEVIRKHLLAITRNVAQLKRRVPYTLDMLERDPDTLWILERGVYLCIQNLLDCFTHIISADLNEEWDSYSEAVSILRGRGIISSPNEELLHMMIGLRNRLSHQYLGIDNSVLVDVANNRLNDLNLLAIAAYCSMPLPKG